MAVMPRERWTDDRLDGLEQKVDNGFARGDSDIRELKSEMNERFDKVDARFEKVEGKIETGMNELRGEIKEVSRNLLALHELFSRMSFGAAVAFAVALIGAVGTHAL